MEQKSLNINEECGKIGKKFWQYAGGQELLTGRFRIYGKL